MNAFRRCIALTLLVVGCLAGAASPALGQGQEDRLRALEKRVAELTALVESRDADAIDELRRQIDLLTREIERLRLGDEVVRADSSRFGFGPAASKVYDVGAGVSIGGYGEMLYENFAGETEGGGPSGARDQLDFLRAVLYAGYKFDDRFLLNTEFEFEHAATGNAGSVSVEFAYLEYLLGERAGVRAGMLLLPVGFVNEWHEPTTFLGTERPLTEQRIIPSTWRENGIGAFAELSDVSLRAVIVNGLDAVGGGSSNAGGFGAAGLRGGRQKGSKAVAEDFAISARADYTGVPGLLAGVSAYVGNSGQGAADPLRPGESIGGRTVIVDAHASYRAGGLDLRALAATASVNDVPALNAARGLTGAETIGERLEGWYVHAGYDVFAASRTDVGLVPYVRYEQLDTQAEVPAGFSADPANDARIVTLGLAVRPNPQIILKADYQLRSTQADTGVDQFNVALGYIF